MENPAPQLYANDVFVDPLEQADFTKLFSSEVEYEPVSREEVFCLLRHLHDPEHPNLSLEQLRVVRLEDINVQNDIVSVAYTPTIPTCSVATVIGLTLVSKLRYCLPDKYKIRVTVAPKTHDQELSINKQLADKERVAAAMENKNLLRMVRRAVKNTDPIPIHLLCF